MKLARHWFFSLFGGRWPLYGVLCAALWVILPFNAGAASTPLYSANVPLPESGAADDTGAFQKALQEVFVKVSGQRNILSQPPIQQAVQQANDWVLRYQSIASPVTSAGTATTPWIRVDFDPERVNNQIEEAGFQVWKGSRGPVLVWLIVDQAGTPHMLSENAETQHEWVMLFKQAAQARGINVIFPILDLYEGTQLDLEAMKAFDQQALKNASLRYHNTYFLAGYIQENQSQWQSQWLLHRDTVSPQWQINAASKEELVQAVATRFADEWIRSAQQPAIITSQADKLLLTIENVSTLEAYAQVLRGLEKLHSANKIELVELAHHTAVFAISTPGLSYDLVQGLLLETWLVPTHSAQATSSHLYYRYNP